MLPSKEGKSKMSPMLFRHLTNYFHREGDAVAIFNNSWSWNLMCRSFNVSLLHVPSLAWTGDCISVEFGQDKTKKDGGKRNKTAMMKHLFANPFEPQVCHTFTPHVCHTFVSHLHTVYATHLRHAFTPHLRYAGLSFCLSWITHWASFSYGIKKRRQTLTQGLFQEDVAHVISRLTNRP